MEVYGFYSSTPSNFVKKDGKVFTTLSIVFDSSIDEIKYDEIEKFIIHDTEVISILSIIPIPTKTIKIYKSDNTTYSEVILNRIILDDMSIGYLVKKKLISGTNKYESNGEITIVPSSLSDIESVKEVIKNQSYLIEINCSRSRFDFCPPPTQ